MNSIELITEQDVSVKEFAVHEYVAFASDFGWPAGYFPASIPTTLGNGEPLQRLRIREDGTSVYKQSLGCVVVLVYND